MPPDKKSIRALIANDYDNLYSTDLTLLANHLFKNKVIKSMAHVGRLLIVVFEDGTAATCTYDAQIRQPAWATMDTNAGLIRNVFAIAINGRWKFLFVVQPTATATSFTLFEFDPDEGPYYDELLPVTLDHMDAGKVDMPILRDNEALYHFYHVHGWFDKASQSTLTDDNLPSVPLPTDMNLGNGSHCVGLPYRSYIETLNLAETVTDGPTLGRRQSVPRVRIQVNNTRGLRVGPTLDRLSTVKERQFEEYGQITDLSTGYIRQELSPSWRTNGRIVIEASDAQPMEVLAVIPDTDVGAD